MNLDDLLCVGVTDNILLSSTIGRNKNLITGEVRPSVREVTACLLACLLALAGTLGCVATDLNEGPPNPHGSFFRTATHPFPPPTHTTTTTHPSIHPSPIPPTHTTTTTTTTTTTYPSPPHPTPTPPPPGAGRHHQRDAGAVGRAGQVGRAGDEHGRGDGRRRRPGAHHHRRLHRDGTGQAVRRFCFFPPFFCAFCAGGWGDGWMDGGLGMV